MMREQGWSTPARKGEGFLCLCMPCWVLTAEYEIPVAVKLRGNELQTKTLLKTKLKPPNKHTAIKQNTITNHHSK